MFTFYDKTYDYIIALFAALIGMAFPLILQSIQKIDEKYDSSVLSDSFYGDRVYRFFKALFYPFVFVVALSPFYLGYISDPHVQYLVHVIMLVWLLVLLISVLLLFERIVVFHRIDKLLELLSGNSTSKSARMVFDVLRYAAKSDSHETYKRAISCLNSYYYKEIKETRDNTPVEFSDNLNGILYLFANAIGNTNNSFLFSKNEIIPLLFEHYTNHYISEKTYKAVWYMLNQAAMANNQQWLKVYWTFADQYYRFKSNSVEEGVFNSHMRRFYEFNVMYGGLLVYHKRYDQLAHLMSFSHSSVKPYILIPGTFAGILEFALSIDHMLDVFLCIEEKYPIVFLDKGIKTDVAIASEVYKYLGLLFVRLWSYDDYNITFSNPKELPACSQTCIDKNKAAIRCMEILKDKIEYWYKSGEINDFSLRVIPPIDDVEGLISDYIEKANQTIGTIDKETGHDDGKLNNILDELVIDNANKHFAVPSSSNLIEKKPIDVCEKEIMASIDVERRFLQKGRLEECSGIGSALAAELDLELKTQYVRQLKKVDGVISEQVPFKDIKNYIKQLSLSTNDCIIGMSNVLDIETEAVKINTTPCSYNNVLIIMKYEELPSIDIVKPSNLSHDKLEIDPYNHLYYSIDEKTDKYIIKVFQTIKIGMYSKTPSVRIINIVY